MVTMVVAGLLTARTLRLRTSGATPGPQQYLVRAEVGDQLFDLAVRPLTGGEVGSAPTNATSALRQAAEGETSVLFVFTTTCPYCAQSAATVRQLATVLRGRDVRLLGLALDGVRLGGAEPADLAEEFIYPVFVPRDASEANMIGVDRVPALLLLDPDAVVREIWIGQVTEETYHDVLRSLDELAPGTP